MSLGSTEDLEANGDRNSDGRCSLLPAGQEKGRKVSTHVLPAGCFDQQRTHLAVVGGQECGAFQAVTVKNPASDEQGCPLVPFSESLRSGHPVGQYGGSLHRILDQIDGRESPSDPVEFIGLVEPFVLSTHNVVDRHHEADSRSIQWSCR